jgi:hypothetical protein
VTPREPAVFPGAFLVDGQKKPLFLAIDHLRLLSVDHSALPLRERPT